MRKNTHVLMGPESNREMQPGPARKGRWPKTFHTHSPEDTDHLQRMEEQKKPLIVRKKK
jgi:hypothetical protein